MPNDNATRPDYGLDAPDVIRNLGLVAIIGLALWGSAVLRWWFGSSPDAATHPRQFVFSKNPALRRRHG
ncbi:MAG: hypothetical protein M3P29_09000 [Acidobacteriota bacterium]|nr:hypothetical protein [Acidobacteriota bacterium]